MTHPEAQDKDGNWYSVGAGVIVPLGEVSTIALSKDPTGAPPALAADLAPDNADGAETDKQTDQANAAGA